MISLDGLRPEFYRDERFGCDELFRLAREFGFFESVTPVYPSVTFTNHASIATGLLPKDHGVFTNTRFAKDQVSGWIGGESSDWFFDQSALRAAPIWERLEEGGGRAAVLRWPVSRGGKASWLIPEIFPVGSADVSETWRLTLKTVSAKSLSLLSSFATPVTYEELDRFTIRTAKKLLSEEGPDLILAHLVGLDHFSHEYGKNSREAITYLRKLDAMLRELLLSVDLSTTRVWIFGDHGFQDFHRRIHLNALLAQHGWIRAREGRIVDWRAVAHTACGQAAIYVRDPADGLEVERFLQSQAWGKFRVVRRAALERLGAFPEAVCAVDAAAGFSMGQRLHGDWIQTLTRIRGEHGYLPTRPEMQTGWVLADLAEKGAGNLGRASVLDLFSRAAGMLGIRGEHPLQRGTEKTGRDTGNA